VRQKKQAEKTQKLKVNIQRKSILVVKYATTGASKKGNMPMGEVAKPD
jgi:hypothetical protein